MNILSVVVDIVGTEQNREHEYIVCGGRHSGNRTENVIILSVVVDMIVLSVVVDIVGTQQRT